MLVRFDEFASAVVLVVILPVCRCDDENIDYFLIKHGY